MSEIFDTASHFLQGKPVYPAIRRALNLLFNACTASFIYETNYGSYQLLDITDYKGIFEFLMKGKFIIPLGVFVLVYFFTTFFSVILFAILSHFRSIRFQRGIVEGFNKKELKKMLVAINKISSKALPMDLTPQNMAEAYLKIKVEEPNFFKEIQDEAKKIGKDMQENFEMLIRAAIAISIFKYTLDQFGWWLYLIMVLIMIVSMIFFVATSILFDAIPTIIAYIQALGERAIKERQLIPSSPLVNKDEIAN